MPPVDMGEWADEIMDRAEREVPPIPARDATEVRPLLNLKPMNGIHYIIRTGR
jgi:hypothetical protein